MKRIKKGVNISNLKPQMLIAWDVIDILMARVYKDAMITSGCDSKHGRGSLHYIGHALDFRDYDLTRDQKETMKREFNDALGDDFDFVIEADHIHIEYQPK